ncbi:MerR family transcriptional regulator [Planococcus salinus]|uniref:MerR family transcriptional regulator n=1 Tax=Planococcus salinus TaxID=1848460 RepID=A0A3M8P945_9BACL|nr:MerR family transcriptional regulator [Planococcus salinus]RNF39704.1 MerR family transcriptional regulator [Planococcus salinus]
MYNIKAAAKVLDMPKVTIRSWETRYGAITPARSESGHRLYSDQNLEDLKWLKIQVQEKGMKISEAVKQLHASRKQFHPADENIDTDPEQKYDKQIRELYTAAVDMDTERFNYFLDLNFSLFHHRIVFFSILVPLMIRIGDAWENGQISVAHEHMISHIIQQRFAHFFRIFPVSPRLPKVMALCPSGEHHQLGLLLFTLFLRENGFPVIYIGADTPLEGISEMVNKQDIELVCISIAHPSLRPTIEEYVNDLSNASPGLQFVVGGAGAEKMEAGQNTRLMGSDYNDWKKWLTEELL